MKNEKKRPDPIPCKIKRKGTCKWFNSQKGYGFITPEDNSADVFVHQSVIYARGFRSLSEGEEVEYYLDLSETEKSKAAKVTGPNGSYVKSTPPTPLRSPPFPLPQQNYFPLWSPSPYFQYPAYQYYHQQQTVFYPPPHLQQQTRRKNKAEEEK